MPWARFDDRFDDDKDLAFLSSDSVALHLCATTWSNRNLTDGFIPIGQVRRLFGYSDQGLHLLLNACAEGNEPWWVKVDGGYQIRSFLNYNKSAESVRQDREQRKLAGVASAEKRWGGSDRSEAAERSDERPVERTPKQTVKRRAKEIVSESNNGVHNEPLNGSLNSPPNDLLNENDAPVSRIQDPRILEPRTPKPPLREGFWDEFCLVYPKRNGSLEKSKARIRFDQLVKSGIDPEVIIAGAKRYREWCDHFQKTRTELVKQMTTFLNGRAWEEEFEIPDRKPEPAISDEIRYRKAPMEGVDFWRRSSVSGKELPIGRFEIGGETEKLKIGPNGERLAEPFDRAGWLEERGIAEVAS